MKNDAATTWHRETLIEAVVLRVKGEIDELIPANTPADMRAAIHDEMLPNSRFELRRLTVDELMDDLMVEHHIDDAIATTQYLVDRVRVRSNSPSSSTEQVCLDCSGTGAFDLWSGEPCESCEGRGVPRSLNRCGRDVVFIRFG